MKKYGAYLSCRNFGCLGSGVDKARTTSDVDMFASKNLGGASLTRPATI